jgi:hypothetical protein
MFYKSHVEDIIHASQESHVEKLSCDMYASHETHVESPMQASQELDVCVMHASQEKKMR